MDKNLMNITEREDRIGRYLKDQLKPFVFAEFSQEYMKKAKIENIVEGVPIPLRKEDLQIFAGGSGVSGKVIAENMAYVMGCDPHFKYNNQYREFLLKVFNHKIYEGMLKKGRDAAEKEEYIYACIQFRATLVMKPDYLHGMYSYARVCRSLYLEGDDPEFIGRFKAEALDYFEMLTEVHPRFGMAYYYLGYAYLNMGLYAKTEATWKIFLKKSRNGKDSKEIKERLEQIKEPIKIEEGCNLVLRGSFKQGREVLEGFLNTRFDDWWPLHYYLGVCYEEDGETDKAIKAFEFVLKKNPAHMETIAEMTRVYQALGDKEMYEKYSKKLEIVKKNLEEEVADNRVNKADQEEKLEQKSKARTEKKVNEAKKNSEEEKQPRFKKIGKSE